MMLKLVMSTGRTGTTLLSHLMSNTQIDCDVRHQELGSRFYNILGNISGIASQEKILLNRKILDFILGEKKNVIVVDPLLSMLVYNSYSGNEINDKCKIVHLVRDPRDFVTSFMNWKAGSVKRMILHHFVPFWQPNPWILGQCSLSARLKMSKFEHFSWIWYYKNSLFKNKFSHTENYLLLKFEDLVSNQKQSLELILKFFGYDDIDIDWIKYPENKINRSNKRYFPNWQNWNKDRAKILDGWCGNLMRYYDYGSEEQWRNLLK